MFTCTIWDWPVVVDDHFPYSQSYRCQRYCCTIVATASIIRKQVAMRQLMMTMSVMAIVVVASPEVASDSFDRKRSMDFVHWTDPFPQITPTFLFLFFSGFFLFFLLHSQSVAWVPFYTCTGLFFYTLNCSLVYIFGLLVVCVDFFLHAECLSISSLLWKSPFGVCSLTFPILYLPKLLFSVRTGTNW